MPSSFTYMQRLATTFGTANPTGDKPDYLTRYIGGHNRTNHPYISGYWQLFINLPRMIFADDHDTTEQWLHCTAEGFTPPNRSLNKVDVPGQGGTGASFIAGQTLSRTFSCTFREYQNLPVSDIFQRWTGVIDPYVGVSELPGGQWLPYSYKGNAFVIQTKPVGGMKRGIDTSLKEIDLENVWFFHGIFPEGANEDAFSSDIATNDSAQLSISFSFDGWPLNKSEPFIVEQALKHLEGWAYQRSTYDKYIDKSGIGQPYGIS